MGLKRRKAFHLADMAIMIHDSACASSKNAIGIFFFNCSDIFHRRVIDVLYRPRIILAYANFSLCRFFCDDESYQVINLIKSYCNKLLVMK